MKIVVIGGTGLIGSNVVKNLREHGHEAVPASPKLGVNTITGEGLADALEGASVVVDVSNSPSFEDAAVLSFFETSTRNLLAAETAAGVGHHVALSIVGIDRSPDNGYFKAKIAQEKLIEAGPIPYSIVRSTQFFEFIDGIADSATTGKEVHMAPVAFQPIAADDVGEGGRQGRDGASAEWSPGNRRPGAAPLRRRHSQRLICAQRSASGCGRSGARSTSARSRASTRSSRSTARSWADPI